MRWALGSVTTKLLRTTNRPVLVVRGSETPPKNIRVPHRIMIALDGSTLAERALPMATNLARMTGAELLLTQVIESYDAPFAVFNSSDSLNHMREVAFGYLEHVANNLREETGRHITTTVPVGHVAEALLEEAQRKEIGLVVLGRHGIGAAHATFLGGTADKLTQASNLPLLIAS
ncbi:MAG: universal stress protein [Oscillochloris sp.]|nr:universal stress protein [Oscillochloris sp.]